MVSFFLELYVSAAADIPSKYRYRALLEYLETIVTYALNPIQRYLDSLRLEADPEDIRKNLSSLPSQIIPQDVSTHLVLQPELGRRDLKEDGDNYSSRSRAFSVCSGRFQRSAYSGYSAASNLRFKSPQQRRRWKVNVRKFLERQQEIERKEQECLLKVQ